MTPLKVVDAGLRRLLLQVQQGEARARVEADPVASGVALDGAKVPGWGEGLWLSTPACAHATCLLAMALSPSPHP